MYIIFYKFLTSLAIFLAIALSQTPEIETESHWESESLWSSKAESPWPTETDISSKSPSEKSILEFIQSLDSSSVSGVCDN